MISPEKAYNRYLITIFVTNRVYNDFEEVYEYNRISWICTPKTFRGHIQSIVLQAIDVEDNHNSIVRKRNT